MTKELDDEQAFLKREAHKAPVYGNAQVIVSLLTGISEGRKAVEKNKKAIEQENNTLTQTLLPALGKAQHEVEDATKALAIEENTLSTEEKEVTELNLQKLRKQRDAAKDLLGHITLAQERIGNLSAARRKVEKAQQALVERQTTLKKKVEQLAAMEQPIHDAKVKMDTCKENLDKQIDSVNKFARTLRLKLHVGDICPVCRQTITAELPHEEELAILVDGLHAACDEAEKHYKDLIDKRHSLEAEIKTETKAIEREIKTLQEDNSVAEAHQKASEACKICGIDKLDDATLPKLVAAEDKTQENMSALDGKIQIGETKEAALKTHRQELETKRKALDNLKAEAQEKEKTVNACQSRIATAEALINTKNKEVEAAVTKVSELLSSVSWNTDWNASPEAFAQMLTSATNHYNNLSKRKQDIEPQLQTLITNRNNVAAVITSIKEAHPAWKDMPPREPKKTDMLFQKANAICNKLNAALTQIKNAVTNYADSKEKLDQYLAQNKTMTMERLLTLDQYTSEAVTRESEALTRYSNNVVAKHTLLENAKRNLADHQEKKPQLTEEDTPETLQNRIRQLEEKKSHLSEQKGAIIQELKTDEKNKAELGKLIDEAEKKEAEYQKWSRLNQLIGDNTGSKFRKIAQSYVLTSLIRSANSYMQTLTSRYTLKVTPGTFVIMLEDAYQGFASRAASTISGGESFLVSLSLALALSDIGQSLAVDTLFIDEGFGTLSGEPLQNAINTLRTLHTKAGRHVGIISHIEELKENIPVQIQVNQEGHNSSSIIRIVPE